MIEKCEHLYRFRNIENLIGEERQELANQQIYFAPPEKLNDPLEGYIDLFWRGDAIVWENFIKHYLRVLNESFSAILEVVDINKIKIADFEKQLEEYLFNCEDTKSEDSAYSYNKMYNAFFASKEMQKLPKLLGNKEQSIRRLELLTYLELIHTRALNYLKRIFNKTSPDVKANIYEDTSKLACVLAKTELSINEQKNYNTVLLKSKEKVIEYMAQSNFKPNSLQNFIEIDFPKIYVSKLHKLIYNKWYSVSFMTNCENSAIWSHYANKHTGVCLKFKTKNENDKITLANSQLFPLAKVDYIGDFINIDFFKRLGGRLNPNQLISCWYSDKNGNLSTYGSHLNDESSIKKWSKEHWRNFHEITNSKLKVWEDEEEYRMILYDTFNGQYDTKESRQMKYDFNDLEAIIFGIKTSDADKIKLMNIIKEKDKNNRVKFCQAYYSHEDKCIKYE